MGTVCSFTRAKVSQEARLTARFRLEMAHLSGLGLSEPWFLRMAGDRHWEMIAQASGQTGLAMKTAEGRAVYAAFCSTALEIAPLFEGLLDAQVTLVSVLHQVKGGRLGSIHVLSHPEKGVLARLRMVSCFLSHDATRSNRRLIRSALPGLETLQAAPRELMELDQNARSAARLARSLAPKEAVMRYTPLPALDFNGVGLLYFPTFSKIAEMARPHRIAGLRRDVTYLSNLDAGEEVRVEDIGQGLVLRGQDERPLAVIR